jgi:uncharacterized protein
LDVPRGVLPVLAALLLALAALKLIALLLEPRMAFFPFAGEQVTPAAHGLTFQPLTIETHDGESLRGWWMPHPSPRAQVIYFHGNGGNLSIWSDVLAGVVAQRFSVLAVDYRGYGASTGRPSERGLYRDVDATIARFHAGLRDPSRPLLYWGRSLGATMAARGAAVREPDGLVLESGFRDAVSLFDRNPIMWGLSWFASYRFTTVKWLTRVNCPILVLHGTADSVIPFRHGRALFEAIRSPRKRFVEIPGGDHNDLAPPDPASYWTAITSFVEELPRTPSP